MRCGIRSRDPRNVPQETVDFTGSGPGLGLDSGFSFTKLLGLEDEGLPAGTPIPPPLLSGTAGGPDHLAPAWRRLVAPPGVFTPPLPPGQVCQSPCGMWNDVFPSLAAGDHQLRRARHPVSALVLWSVEFHGWASFRLARTVSLEASVSNLLFAWRCL